MLIIRQYTILKRYRFASIFFSAYVNAPHITVTLSLCLCLAGGFGLFSFKGAKSMAGLEICSALIGSGTAAIYASGILWMEECMGIIPVNNRKWPL